VIEVSVGKLKKSEARKVLVTNKATTLSEIISYKDYLSRELRIRIK